MQRSPEDREMDSKGEKNQDEPRDGKDDRALSLRKQFAVSGTGTGSSSVEDRPCCTNIAVSVYKKAWEGARKALPRATRHRQQQQSSDNQQSQQQPTASFDSDDELHTECSLDYGEDSELKREGVFRLKTEVGRRGDHADRNPRPSLRGLESLSSDLEEFAEEATGPENLDLEAFKKTYMSDLMIPEETQEEIGESKTDKETDNGKKSIQTRRRRVRPNDETSNPEANGKQRQSDDTTFKTIDDIEQYVKVTCDQVMANVKEEVKVRGSSPEPLAAVEKADNKSGDERTEQPNNDNDQPRGSGIFKVKPPMLTIDMRNEESQESKESTDVVTMPSIEIPTITITEDQLDDSSVVLSEATLHGSDEDFTDLPEDDVSKGGSFKGKTEMIKTKVKKFSHKVKDIFKKGDKVAVSENPEYIDREEEKRRRKEEDQQRKREEEKEAERKRRLEEQERKAELEAKKEEERRKKEEAERRRRDEELERRALEMERKAEQEAKKEEERRRKEEEKRKKEEEKKAREEGKRLREEEEKRRKEEEKMKKEEERRMKAEEEKRRKEEERRRKEEEKRKKEEEKKRDEELRKMRELEKAVTREEEERKKRETSAKRRQEEDEAGRKTEDNKDDAQDGLRRKLGEDQVSLEPSQPVAGEFDEDSKNETQGYYNVEVTRRTSSHSLPSAANSAHMSTSTSQQTIMLQRSVSRPRDRSPSREDENFGQTESDADGDHMNGRRRKKMRKRLRDTKAKLINLKSKALESLPSMLTLKNRVKDILPTISSSTGSPAHGDEYGDSVKREQKAFHEIRKRYPDSENEFFSDSELVESRKNTLKKKAGGESVTDEQAMYEEIEATEDRVDLLFTPISSPLRPPRKSDFGIFHQSEPNISRHGTPKKPKRAPPPRPPPPKTLQASLETMEDIDLEGSARDINANSIKPDQQSHDERLPAHIFYRKVLKEWQERNLKRLDEMLISQSSPNLSPVHSKPLENITNRPSRPGRPGRPPPPPSSISFYDRPRPPKRVTRAGLLREARAREREVIRAAQHHDDGGYEALDSGGTGDHGLPPLPPPRARASSRRQSSSRSPASSFRSASNTVTRRKLNLDYFTPSDKADLATDCLYWKPFSWKTGRCRSLTELYLRKRKPPMPTAESELAGETIERSLSYRLMTQYCAPPRPPPLGTSNSSEPIYSTVDRSKKIKREIVSSSSDEYIQSRPLPAPPLPPRTRRKTSRSRSNSPFVSLGVERGPFNGNPDSETRTFIRGVSPIGISVRDACVDTHLDLPLKLEEKECQTSLEDIVDRLAISPSSDRDSVTPVPMPILVPVKISDTGAERKLSVSSKESSPPMATANNGHNRGEKSPEIRTDDEGSSKMTSYYDAEECDTDMDTFTDLDSIGTETLTSSQFHSLIDPSEHSLASTGRGKPASGPSKLTSTDVIVSISSNDPLHAERIHIDEDSDDDMLQPRNTCQSEMRAYISRRMRPDSMEGSD